MKEVLNLPNVCVCVSTDHVSGLEKADLALINFCKVSVACMHGMNNNLSSLHGVVESLA